MKATTALEFRYGSRQKDEKKQKINFYELGKLLKTNDMNVGGGRILANLLQAPLSAFNIGNSAVCITVDLSNPAGTVESLLYWLNVTKEFT